MTPAGSINGIKLVSKLTVYTGQGINVNAVFKRRSFFLFLMIINIMFIASYLYINSLTELLVFARKTIFLPAENTHCHLKGAI